VSGVKDLVRPLWRKAAERAAQAYVAGPSVGDAVKVGRRWRGRRVRTTIGFWNDGADPATKVQHETLKCVGALERFLPGGYVSIKLAAMGYREDLLRPILVRAAKAGFRVHFDSLGPETVDETNSVIDRARALHDDLGCTLPGRWVRSVDDAQRATDRGLAVRVVKGQWADPDAPDRDAREGYLAVVRRLAGKARLVAVATHDVPLAERCVRLLADAGTPCELELLHGLPMRKALSLARRRRVPVRIYVPYGESWLPYSLDYVERHPAVMLWLVRDLLGG
jgi:proline dehydrogenase